MKKQLLMMLVMMMAMVSQAVGANSQSSFAQVPVVEEFTGTWCGWCTIGYEGMESAQATFGDNAVLIAVHVGDVMEISDYKSVADRADGYPSSLINRSVDAYPSPYNLSYYINQSLNKGATAEIKVTASWNDGTKTAIMIDTETRFSFSDNNGQYGIAFVLIEDGMTGTGSGWAQSNYLSGNSNYAESYPFWYKAPEKVTGVVFNHVAVGAWDIENGAEGSVKSSFAAGEVLKYSRKIDISSKSIIQDKSKLKVAALLIDRKAGAIVNAAQTTIGPLEGEVSDDPSTGNIEIAEDSNITFEGQVLKKGYSYSSADFYSVKSGRFSVSGDGKTITFDNVKIESGQSVFEINESSVAIVLKGENEVRTSNYVVLGVSSDVLTIRGDGSLKTKSSWYDIHHSARNVIIENTSLICEGPTAIGNNNWKDSNYFHLTIKNSLVKGNRLFRLSSLTMDGCCIKKPENGLFDKEEMDRSQIKDGNGNSAESFIIDKLESSIIQKGNSVTPLDFGTIYTLKGESTTVPVKIVNNGKEPVSSISYTVTTNGSTSVETTLSLEKIPYQNSATINIAVSGGEEARRYNKSITITKVNGAKNEATAMTANGSLIVITEKPAVVPVVEEFTGTWCGWCTVGYDGMERTKQAFGDKAVLIAVHASDPMETSDYASIANRADGYPSSIINRSIDAYPHEGTLGYYINQSMDNITLGEIKAEATWANNEKTAIKINTDTKFVYTDENGQYGIAVVLIEDGMTGSGSGWAQSNYLSGDSDYAESNPFWYNAGSKVTGVEFNHVAVGAWDVEYGADGSVKSSFAAGEVLRYSREIDITSKSIIQDKSMLKVAVLLIDRSTGAIVNASQTAIGSPTETIVTSVPIAIPAGGKLAMVSEYDLDFTSLESQGVKAYICTGYEIATKKLWMTRVNDVPANTPILVKGNAGNYSVPVGSSMIYYPQNFLLGNAISDATVDKTAGFINYGVSQSSGNIGPLPATTETFGKGKAYFHVPASVASKVASSDKVHFEMGAGGKLAMVSIYDLDFTESEAEGLKAYTVTGFDSKKTIWLTRVMTASAGTPLLLRGASSGKYDVKSSAVQMAYVNMPDGNTGDAEVTLSPVTDGSVIYVLSLGSGSFGPLGKEAKFAKGKAWLPVPKVFHDMIAASRGMSKDASELEAEVMCLFVDANTTAIDKISAGKSGDDAWYNLNGQRINTPTKKGLYIKNGVKVIVK